MPGSDDSVEACIQRLLAAEREAQAVVADFSLRAEVRVQEARAAASRIGARAERRIAAVRAAVDARLAVREGTVRAALEALEAAPTAEPGLDVRVEQAVAELARALTGGTA